MDNNNRAAHGRFLNVKPAVGLLTSTARTFIQNGVTTEYATQVLGKTIDHGRLYAQLLTKSSRVVYSSSSSSSNNKSPNEIDSTPTLTNQYNHISTQVIGIVKHFDDLLINENDIKSPDQTNKTTFTKSDNDDENVVTFIKNTDYITPNNPSQVHMHPVASNAVNFGSGEEVVEFELLPQSLAQVRNISTDEKAEVRHTFRVLESSSSSSSTSSNGENANNHGVKVQINPKKVKLNIDLPTFTVPSGYSFEGIDSNLYGSSEDTSDNNQERDLFSSSSQPVDEQINRVGKQLASVAIPIAGFSEEEKQLQSITYYGFADFTTIVGNTVIIFSPNTAPPSMGKVTSIKGQATLHSRIDPTKTVKQDEPISQTKFLTLNAIEEPKESMADTTTTTEQAQTSTINEPQEYDEISTKELIESTTDDGSEMEESQSAQEQEQKFSVLAKEQNSLKYNLSPKVIEASEVPTTSEELAQTPSVQIISASSVSKTDTMMLSIPSNEDIAKIFASLAAKDKSSSSSLSQESIRDQTAETLTGATTIFFEDDPFLLISLSAKEDIAPSKSQHESLNIVTSLNMKDIEVTIDNEMNMLTTTEDQQEATSPAVHTTESDDDEATTENINKKPECNEGYVLKPSKLEETITYLTTIYIPDDEDDSITTTSVQSYRQPKTNIVYECTKSMKTEEITATSVQSESTNSKVFESEFVKTINHNRLLNYVKETTQAPTTTTTEEPTTENQTEDVNEDVPNAATTENLEGNTIEAITSSFSSSTTTEASNDSDEENIELIYKTLFTTYTYLTTFFHGYTSSVSSRKEVVTNIVTSTLDMSLIKSDTVLADLLESMSTGEASQRIEPTRAVGGVGVTETKAHKEQTISIEDVFDDSIAESLNEATPVLSNSIEASHVEGSHKTFYTTYTYFTTIFADGETEIASRTEVYTNFVGPSVKPTQLIEEDKIFATNSMEKVNTIFNEDEQQNEEPTTESAEDDLDNHVIQKSYSTMVRKSESSTQAGTVTTTQTIEEEVEEQTTEPSMEKAQETTVAVNKANSTYKVIKLPDTKRVVESIRKQLNNILEDQISSESQNEEILPSSTLLLQTSYTTFTYFTTEYAGDTSQVLSRLETITNVVTETLQPTQTIVIPPAALADEPVLPTTYFTTFTYYTTYFKEGEVLTLSNTKIISNIIAPTATALAIDDIFPTARIVPIEEAKSSIMVTSPLKTSTIHTQPESEVSQTFVENEASVVTPTSTLVEPTTYFTTYTYFTTSYVGEDTILKSRFETVTNVVTPTVDTVATVTPVGRAINLNNVNLNQITDGKAEKKLIKDKQPLSAATAKAFSQEIVSINVGKIVDAEGISTILYTTKAIGTYIDGSYSQFTDKTSSVIVDESKKSSILEATPNYADNKHKTGLVRLINGEIVVNHTTTLYESKVIGTIIDNRYAQIIESTSSYVIDKTKEASIAPTATSTAIKPTEVVISPTSAVIESSLSDSQNQSEDEHNEDVEEEVIEDEIDENGRKKSRLTFATKKRTFTPVIRPFASRNRPTFAPKRKNLSASSATIITQTDFTPTIRATPAVGKAEGSTRRFAGGNRRLSNAPHAASASATSTPALASGSKRFSRLRTSTLNSATSPSSIAPSGHARIIRPSSVRASQSSSLVGSSSRRINNLFRSSALPGNRLSISPSQVRFRVNPTSAPSLRDSTTTKPTETEDETTEPIETNPDEAENEENKDGEEEVEVSTTTENVRRNQNPLLKFRRPLASSRFQPTSTPRPTQQVAVSTRRSALLQRARSTQPTTTTSTTIKPKPKPPSSLGALKSRPRTSSNGLFPPRALFKQTTEANQVEANDVANESNNNQQNNDNDNDNFELNEENEDAVDPEFDNRNRRENKATFTPQSALRSRKRTKRQAEYGTRSPSRYQRQRPAQIQPQSIARSSYDDVYYDEVEVQTQRPKTTRFTSRYRSTNENDENENTQSTNSNRRIQPTKTAAKVNRAQFTLRSGTEKENLNTYSAPNSRSSNFRRSQNVNANTNGYVPQTSARRKPLPTSSNRSKTSRLRNYGNTYTTETRNGRGRTNVNSRTANTRGSTRARGRVVSDAIEHEYVADFDGTITVTHQIPTEVTIPVLNGGNTEYKNVVTAKISTEILGPQQYSTTSVGHNGNTLVIATEATNIVKGATEITKFFLKETPTTSVTFTPTQINRRKTSFSHIIPSTIYNVEPVVMTIQPQISADAPLANILLSQLLLGNLGGGLPQQQLLGLGGQLQQFNPLQPIQSTPLSPVTEFKTRSTTYVTTLSNAKPTIIPVTFRGKEILTTIYDDSINVITATEFITDTIVTTPTQQQVQSTQNINNLLLQQLLAQQTQPTLLQSPQQLPLNLLNVAAADTDKSQSLLQDSLLTLGKGTRQDSFNDKNNKKIDADELIEEEGIRNDYPDLESYDEQHEHKTENSRAPSVFIKNQIKKLAKSPPRDTSIITLYVSGRKPGEFSTVLSTVITTPDALLQKRAIDDRVIVMASKFPDFYDMYNAEGSNIDEIYMPAASTTNELNLIESSQNGVEYGLPAETQSLESILGDVSNYVTKTFLF